jgi:NADPH2:quinone reductase
MGELPTVMRAVRVKEFGGPENLLIEEVPLPVPGDGEVLVKVEAAGVNPIDTYIRSGQRSDLPTLPFTPGIDGAGLIVKAGPHVNAVKEGERVFISGSKSGTYAEYALCAVRDVYPLTMNFAWSEGAAIGVPYRTAYYALHIATRAKGGETLFIHGGSGSVGIAAIQIAKTLGLAVVASAGSASGMQLAKKHGALRTVNHNEKGYIETALGFTANRGFDIILEMSAHTNLNADIQLLSNGGKVIVIGSRGGIDINARDLMQKNGTLRGMSIMQMSTSEHREIASGLNALVQLGIVQPPLGALIPMKDVADAHRKVLENGKEGKLVLLTRS